MLVKGLSHLAKHDLFDLLIGAPPAQTQAVMAFVEKLTPYDLPRMLPEWVVSIAAGVIFWWEDPFSRLLTSSSGSSKGVSHRSELVFYASISTDMANEFIAQQGVANQLNPRIVELETDDKDTLNPLLPRVRDVD